MAAVAALTESMDRMVQLQADTLWIPVRHSTTIYFGALVCTNWQGYACPARDDDAMVFEGIAIAEADANGVVLGGLPSVDNSAGANGAKYVLVQRKGRIKIALYETPVQAFMSRTVYVRNDNQVFVNQATAVDDVVVGRISKVSWPNKPTTGVASGEVQVEFECGICAPYGRRVGTSTTTSA